MTETVATIDPARWVLSRSGRVAAATLTDRLPAGAHLAASTETKAIQTIVLAAGVRMDQVQCDRRFDEVCRPGEPFDNQHQERRLA